MVVVYNMLYIVDIRVYVGREGQDPVVFSTLSHQCDLESPVYTYLE